MDSTANIFLWTSHFTFIFSEYRASQWYHVSLVVKNGVFKNLPIFTGKHLCQSLFVIKIAGLRVFQKPCRMSFLVNFAKF